MLKYLVAMLCGVSLSGSVYMAGWGPHKQAGDMATADQSTCVPGSPTTPSVAGLAGKIDVKNTQCIVTGEDVGTSTATVEYQGKVYHICCGDCIAEFKKSPDKYVKALEANPAKFGVSRREIRPD